MNDVIRIGKIKYTNVWPIFHYFPIARLQRFVRFEEQVPTELNRAMKAGLVDMGPISSFAYGDNFDDYLLYPDLSVSAHGRVNSILLFHREPIERVAQGRIALPTTSATSVHLLKIIMEKFHGGSPSYEYVAPALDAMMVKHDAALLIGDDAIRAAWTNHGYRITDLGEEWQRQTGQWMSFAVWAIRKRTADLHPELVRDIFEAFVESKQKSLEDPEGMIREAVTTIGGNEPYWQRYFEALCYDFGPAQRRGLQLYCDYAWELGFLPRKVPLQIWSDGGWADQTTTRVNG